MRAVLDANVILSGLLTRAGAPAELLQRWLLGEFELVVSPRLVEEVERALAYPKVRHRVEADAAAQLLATIGELAEEASDPEIQPSVQSRDPGDDYLIALAAATHATLVSGDSDLLALRGTIPVLSPREFLNSLV